MIGRRFVASSPGGPAGKRGAGCPRSLFRFDKIASKNPKKPPGPPASWASPRPSAGTARSRPGRAGSRARRSRAGNAPRPTGLHVTNSRPGSGQRGWRAPLIPLQVTLRAGVGRLQPGKTPTSVPQHCPSVVRIVMAFVCSRVAEGATVVSKQTCPAPRRWGMQSPGTRVQVRVGCLGAFSAGSPSQWNRPCT